ncbi:MAG: hypothetical protein USCAAHI_01333 [Beijerinckiaceae bacterium]|nr:MAG: hypothetical protein USCAAHI_01333 [Beijerinckiaceae bacterium]
MTAYRIEQCCACAGAKDFSISIVTLIILGFLGPLSARDAKVHVFSRPVHKSTLERFPITWNHVIERNRSNSKSWGMSLSKKSSNFFETWSRWQLACSMSRGEHK